jgi:hypothetical protein
MITNNIFTHPNHKYTTHKNLMIWWQLIKTEPFNVNLLSIKNCRKRKKGRRNIRILPNLWRYLYLKFLIQPKYVNIKASSKFKGIKNTGES